MINIRMLLLRIIYNISRLFYGSGLSKISYVNSIYNYVRNVVSPKYMITQINNNKMKVNYRMGGVGHILIEQHDYEPLTSHIFTNKVISGTGSVVDVGANIGFFTLLAARLLDGKSGHEMVFAFEPEKSNYRLLTENIKLNNFYNVKQFQIAISDRGGFTTLYTSKNESGEHNIIGTHGLSKNYRVEMNTLDDVIGLDTPVQLVKIDVEGAETRVLLGAEKLLRKWHPTIIVECWDKGLNEAKSSVQELLDILHSFNYSDITMINEFDKTTENAELKKILEYTETYNFSVNLLCIWNNNNE